MDKEFLEESTFSLEGYRLLLNEFIYLGYDVVLFENVINHKKHLILRHDIDMSLDYALPIAQIEADLKIPSTFFVLLRTEMYNLFSKRNTESLKQLMKLDRKIGLHFDASLYPEDPAAYEAAAEKECMLLEQIIEQPVSCVSFHNPSKILMGAGAIANRISAYDLKFFKEIGYCSDSHGLWQYGHPLQHEAIQQGTALQLLTHPIWWVQQGITSLDKLSDFLEQHVAITTIALAQNSKVYAGKNC